MCGHRSASDALPYDRLWPIPPCDERQGYDRKRGIAVVGTARLNGGDGRKQQYMTATGTQSEVPRTQYGALLRGSQYRRAGISLSGLRRYEVRGTQIAVSVSCEVPSAQYWVRAPEGENPDLADASRIPY